MDTPQISPTPQRRRGRVLWIIATVAIVAAATWIYLGEVDEVADKLHRRRLNDSLYARCSELKARTDSLMLAGDNFAADGSLIGQDYIAAAQSISEAQATAAKANPPLPSPIGTDTKAALRTRLEAAKAALEKQKKIAEGMPSAQKAVSERIARIDSIIYSL